MVFYFVYFKEEEPQMFLVKRIWGELLSETELGREPPNTVGAQVFWEQDKSSYRIVSF
jgi:hypothetical protein